MGCFLFIIVFFVGMFILYFFSTSPILATILSIVLITGIIIFYKKTNEIIKNEEQERIEKIKQSMKKEDFIPNQEYFSLLNSNGIAIDDNNKKVLLLDAKLSIPKYYNFNEILESEVVIDGNTVTQTSRSSQLGGAIVGSVLAGGVGAVIGGLSGSTKSSQEIKKIDLKVVVNDKNNPTYYINFFISPDSSSSQINYQKPMKSIREVNHWHSLISIIIKETDTLEKLDDNKRGFNTISVADEIEKLSNLLKQGIISIEEYEKQKSKLLS